MGRMRWYWLPSVISVLDHLAQAQLLHHLKVGAHDVAVAGGGHVEVELRAAAPGAQRHAAVVVDDRNREGAVDVGRHIQGVINAAHRCASRGGPPRSRVGSGDPFRGGAVDAEILFAHDSQVEFLSLLTARSAAKSRFIVAMSSAHGRASGGPAEARRGDAARVGAGTAVVPLRRGSGTAGGPGERSAHRTERADSPPAASPPFGKPQVNAGTPRSEAV